MGTFIVLMLAIALLPATIRLIEWVADRFIGKPEGDPVWSPRISPRSMDRMMDRRRRYFTDRDPGDETE